MKSKSRIHVKRTLIYVLAFVLLISMSTTLSFGATAKVKSLSFTQPTVKTAKIVKGKSYTFKVAVNPAGASKAVTWKTSNKKVATVSAKGVVKAKKTGTVKITAISKSNKLLNFIIADHKNIHCLLNCFFHPYSLFKLKSNGN